VKKRKLGPDKKTRARLKRSAARREAINDPLGSFVDDPVGPSSPGPADNPTVPLPSFPEQPTGEYCLVVGRQSSNKGTHSSTVKGKTVQLGLAENIVRREGEGRIMGERLAANAPRPHTFSSINATFHKRGSTESTVWVGGKSALVKDIRALIEALPSDASLTVMIRAIDGFTSDVRSFQRFLEYCKDKVKLQVVFQYYNVCAMTDHSRLVPFRGLGSVMAFTGDEMLDHFTGAVLSSDVERIVTIWENVNEKKGGKMVGLKDRNMLPPEDFCPANRL